MHTYLLKVDRQHPEPEIIGRAGGIIRAGGLVAFPTETVYGLGGDALNPASSKKIYAAKGRPSDNPLIVHIADFGDLPRLVRHIPKGAEQLADAFWPGPLTMIFEKSDAVPPETSGGLDTVAVRFPKDQTAMALIKAGGGYIAAPSANASGRPSPTSAEHVYEDLNGRIDMILDSGPVGIGLESTIVDFTGEQPTVLRPGYISLSMLREILGEVQMDPGLLSEDDRRPPKAPGMKYRHYAPKAELTIVSGEQGEAARAIRLLCLSDLAKGKKAKVIASRETKALYGGLDVHVIGSRQREEEIAANLYEVLRSFDREETDTIYSEDFSTPRMGEAIMNRLLKAAGHRVLEAGALLKKEDGQ